MEQSSQTSTFNGPVWVERGTPLSEAAMCMAEAGTSSVLVGAPGELVSILTERDLARAVAGGVSPASPAEDAAAPTPLTVDRSGSVADAAQLMLDNGIRHLVVTEGDRAVGVISMRDVLAALLLPARPEVAVVVGWAPSSTSPPEHWWG